LVTFGILSISPGTEAGNSVVGIWRKCGWVLLHLHYSVH